MHRLWRIADIVYLICNELWSGGELCALACTSKSVGRQALAFLWEDLSDTRHLTAFFKLSYDSAAFYGQLVRSLTVNGRKPKRDIERLASGSNGAIFPNLRTVKLHPTLPFDLLAALRLLPARLPNIEITFPSTPLGIVKLDWDLWSEPVKDLLDRCGSKDGSQGTLTVDGMREFEDASIPKILEALGSPHVSLAEFRGLNIPIDPSLLAAFSGFSRLSSLHLHCRRNEQLALERNIPDNIPVTGGFKALRCLNLSCPFGTITRVMRYIEACLEDISISTNIMNVSNEALRDFAHTISLQHGPTLKRLDLRFDDDQHRGLLFGWSTFSALQECHRMESFSLHYASFSTSHFGLSDTHLEVIATSWPQLRQLSVIWFPFEGDDDIVPSLRSLVTLGANCPNLAHLALSTIDTGGAGVPVPPTGPPPERHPVLTIHLSKIILLRPFLDGLMAFPEQLRAQGEIHVERVKWSLRAFRNGENVRVRCADLEEQKRNKL